MLSRNLASRTALLAQLSAHPWELNPQVMATEMVSLSTTPTFDALVHDLASGPEQTGPAADSTGRIVIGWGRHDRLCLPRQAARAKAAFPSADLHWFKSSGHFPAWDMPEETVAVILAATQSILAGGFMLKMASGTDPVGIGNIAPYAAFGAFYFLVSAIWLTVSDARRNSKIAAA